MKSITIITILAMSLNMGCSAPNSRSIATSSLGGELSPIAVQKIIKGIFHSYLLGQQKLYEFDKKLEVRSDNILESDIYHELQAIRISVDSFEEQFNDFYLKLILIGHLPQYSDHQKESALKVLTIMRQFMDGSIAGKKRLSENLKHLILSNLIRKQLQFFEEVKFLTKDPQVLKALKENTQKKTYSTSKLYAVDKKALMLTLIEQEGDDDFQSFKSNIEKKALELKKHSKIKTIGRATGDVIFPSAGAAGNITGRGFPANTWSLTFDDGPGSKTTPVVLKNLKDRRIKATFFMVARQVEVLPVVAKSIADAGMDIASHSYDHAKLTSVSESNLEKQIFGSKKIIEAKLGKEVKLYRLPYGAGVNVSSIREKIAASKMVHVFWNVDTLDWQDKDPQSIFNRTIKQMQASSQNAGVILFHDIHQQSVIASAMLMDYLKQKNLKVCTVQAVVDQLNQGLNNCQ